MDDLISRAAAVAQIKENYCDWCDHTDLCPSCETRDCIATIEQQVPAVDAIPVEWLQTAIGKFKTAGRTDAIEVVQSLIKAWKSEEELKGLLEAQLECMAKQIFAEMDEKGRNAIIEKLGYVPWSEEEG